MSLSNNIELKNPATKFIQWSGDKGIFQYFDKSKGEKGERVIIPIPLTFLALDTLSTIKGYSDADQSGYWSNEVRDLANEVLIVKTSKGEQIKGLYKDIKESREIKGYKYCQSVYSAIKEEGKLVICNFQMTGAALGAWIDFRRKQDIYKGATMVTGFTDAIKGKTEYKVPIFKLIPVQEITVKEAIALDKELQEYLSKYFNKNKAVQVAHHPNEVQTSRGTLPNEVHEDFETIPFESNPHIPEENNSYEELPF